MDVLLTARVVNKARFAFFIFILLAAISGVRNGSEPAVAISIFIGAGVILSILLVNQYFLHLGKLPKAGQSM